MDPAIVIFAAADNWRIGIAGPGGVSVADVGIAAGASPDEIARTIVAALEADAGPGTGSGILLALPSDRCLCASVRVDDLPARDRRIAMLYRLEEKLPLPAEDVVADFIPAGTSALGVCVETAYARPLVEALESHGVAVDAICPASLLALQRRLLDAAHRGEAAPDAVVWSSDGRVELFVLRDGVVRSWSVLSDDSQDLRLHLGLEPLTDGGPARVHVIGLSDASHRAIGSLPGVELVAPGAAAPIDADATSMAADVLAGRVEPWVNLRRDALAVRDRLRPVRTPVLFAAAAVVLCVACLCTGMLWRAARYDRLATRHTAEQQQAFRHVFPLQPIPPDVRSRLASEERALRALSGGGGGGDPATSPPPEAPGLVVLRDLLARLPADLRYRVLEARLDGGRFTLEGQVNAHGDADTIASALRAHKGLTVEPPRTEQLPESPSGEKAVTFTITGTVAADQPSAAVAAGGRRAGS